MNRCLALCLAALAGLVSVAHADARLVFQINQAAAAPTQKTLSASHFFVRIDSADQTNEFILYQAGKFFPLYRVDTQAKTYTRLTPEVDARLGPVSRYSEAEPPTAAAEGEVTTSGPADNSDNSGSMSNTASAGNDTIAPAPGAGRRLPTVPRFNATANMDSVAGVRCRIVVELIDGEPAIEHCMANKAALGVTEREMRTFARLFVLAREREWGWLVIGTQDEEFISIRSRTPEQQVAWQLASVSHAALPVGYLRVPRDFRPLKAEDTPPVQDDAASSMQ